MLLLESHLHHSRAKLVFPIVAGNRLSPAHSNIINGLYYTLWLLLSQIQFPATLVSSGLNIRVESYEIPSHPLFSSQGVPVEKSYRVSQVTHATSIKYM